MPFTLRGHPESRLLAIDQEGGRRLLPKSLMSQWCVLFLERRFEITPDFYLHGCAPKKVANKTKFVLLIQVSLRPLEQMVHLSVYNMHADYTLLWIFFGSSDPLVRIMLRHVLYYI
jgi:hypothetical protein